jgi:hypothetical protein
MDDEWQPHAEALARAAWGRTLRPRQSYNYNLPEDNMLLNFHFFEILANILSHWFIKP